jgi:hypothetical protein
MQTPQQHSTQYVPGRGYTVRDSKGRVIAKDLNPAQLEQFTRDHSALRSQLHAVIARA